MTVGRQRIGFYGLDDHQVSGIIQLIKSGRVIRLRAFNSRVERKLIMIRWRIKFNLFEGEDEERKHKFTFIIIMNEETCP